MRDPKITTDEKYSLNDAITAWAENVGLRARRQDDIDDEYDDCINEATHRAVEALSVLV